MGSTRPIRVPPAWMHTPMNRPIRSFLAMSIVAVVLAACGTTAAAPSEKPQTPTDAPEPSEPAKPAQPTKPTATPKPASVPAEREIVGTITLYPGTASGPGGSIEEALANASSTDLPFLVNGVLFRDTDGKIYLASSVGDATVPTFGGPVLEVLEYPNDGPTWDMDNAELLGLEEANGIVFQTDAQILGTIETR